MTASYRQGFELADPNERREISRNFFALVIRPGLVVFVEHCSRFGIAMITSTPVRVAVSMQECFA